MALPGSIMSTFFARRLVKKWALGENRVDSLGQHFWLSRLSLFGEEGALGPLFFFLFERQE